MKKIKTKSVKHNISKISKDKNYVLGLDCSSSVLGWGVVDLDSKELVACGYCNLASSKYDLLQRLDYLYNLISQMCEKYSPQCVAIEDIIKFMKGRSSASTIITLTAFNRTAALSAYHSVGNVAFIPVQTIRKIIRQNTKEKKIVKEEMPNVIRKYLYADLKNYKKKTGGISDKSYDQADGIAVAWSYALRNS